MNTPNVSNATILNETAAQPQPQPAAAEAAAAAAQPQPAATTTAQPQVTAAPVAGYNPWNKWIVGALTLAGLAAAGYGGYRYGKKKGVPALAAPEEKTTA